MSLDEIFDHARAGGAKEVCGILAGTGDRVKKIYRMANVSEKAADSYFMDPGEQLKVMKEIFSGMFLLSGWPFLFLFFWLLPFSFFFSPIPEA